MPRRLSLDNEVDTQRERAHDDNDDEREICGAKVCVHVTVIAATTTPAAVAAQAATTTIPIVFEMGSDPVRLGLVVNLNRPGGNITGVTNLVVEVAPKRLELLHELLPAVKVMALLVNSADRNLAQAQLREVLSGARNLGLELHGLSALEDNGFNANVVATV